MMKYDPQKHHRCSIRLKGYDYCVGGFVPLTRYAAGTKPAARQPGAYFVTICAFQRMHVFGEVINGEMILNETGKIARDEWFKTAAIRPYVKLYDDEFVIMPNHGHGIIWIDDEVGTRRHRVLNREEQRAWQRRASTGVPTETIEKFGKPVKGSIPTILRAYKSAVMYAVNAAQNMRGAVLWQRNYGACPELGEGNISSVTIVN